MINCICPAIEKTLVGSKNMKNNSLASRTVPEIAGCPVSLFERSEFMVPLGGAACLYEDIVR